MALEKYQEKRKFEKTPEPKGEKKSESSTKIFVVQKHRARALHYDFRIEHRGVLLSWAVPKGFSMDPKVKHFAKKVEDHPFDYAQFEGIIPKGNYGAGEVIVWDRGVYIAGDDPAKSEKYLDQGLSKPSQHFIVTLLGNKLKGSFVLSQIKDDDWIIFKRDDEHVSKNNVFDERSVVSGKTVEELKDESSG